jgi:hypothetical protein
VDTFDVALPLQIRNPKVGLLFEKKAFFALVVLAYFRYTLV